MKRSRLRLEVPVKLKATLFEHGIDLNRSEAGWRFVSLRGRFTGFTVTSSMAETSDGGGILSINRRTAHFPNSSVRLRFAGGSVLVTYASGHIRWVTEPGFQYYSLLSQGDLPCISQGDLVVFRLAHQDLIPHRRVLADLLPADQGTVWCRAQAPRPSSGSRWYDSDKVAVGGNSRHQACGRLMWVEPIPGDHRTMQIKTLEMVTMVHDPPDFIHPTATLSPDSHVLVSKLPGFSDPIKEMTPCAEVLP